MRTLRGHFSSWSRARQRDERGVTFVLTAICMVLLLWAGAFGVDLGFTVDGDRQAQTMADIAALDLARSVSIADSNISQSATSAWLTTNKLPYVDVDNKANTTFTVQAGIWQSGAWSPVNFGCQTALPPAPLCNAVKVTATQSVPQIFSGGTTKVSRTSIAAVTPEASFSVGSYLASFSTTQSSVLNNLLGTLGSANVTGAGFAGLANESVTLNQLITASGGYLTPSNIMTQQVQASSWLNYLTIAVANQSQLLNCAATPTPYACTASTALSNLSFNSSTSPQLCQLVNISTSGTTQPTSCSPGSLSSSALNTSINVLQLLTTEAELANGSNAVSVGTLGGITGVVSGSLYLTLVQPPQIAYGPVGTTAKTAQITADLQLNLGVAGLLDVPLSGASATGTLQTMTCQNNNGFNRSTISVNGTAISNQNVSLAGVTIGQLSVTGYSGTRGFNSNNVPPTPQTAGSNPATAGSTSPTVTYSGQASPVVSALTANVLAPLLQSLGVSVGGVQAAVYSGNCGAVSLVQ